MEYPMNIAILGTEYTISQHKPSEDKELEGLGGYCSYMVPEIVIGDLREYDQFRDSSDEFIEMMEKQTLRHEIIHAFLNESGLGQNAFASADIPWTQNEEMIDWIAIQFPKIADVFLEIGCM